MSLDQRYPIEVDAGTTFRFACQVGDNDGDVRTYYDDTDLSLTMRFRDGNDAPIRSIPLVFEGGVWRAFLSAEDTASPSIRRAVDYVIDGTYASGDIRRLLQGPLRVRPAGGVTP